jgi:N4-gp56 family major capsid protein
MAAFTSAANTGVTEMTLISSIVQQELLESVVVLPTLDNKSSMVEKGLKQIDIPRFDTDSSGRFGDPETQNPDGMTGVTLKAVDMEVDSIALNKWKNLSYRIPDRLSQQSRVNLEAELSRKAGREFAIYMDKEAIAVLATLTQEVNYSGAGDTMALADITDARKTLNRNNVPEQDRFLLISPEKEADMLKIDNFIKADQYGARDALLNGEIGRVFGFRVIVSNLLTADESYAYHREVAMYAVQQDISFESQRADVTVRATDYSFAAGWGLTLAYEGKKGVKFTVAP